MNFFLIIDFLFHLIQPLNLFTLLNFIDSIHINKISILSAIIGASGSIFGGIITGIVAYLVANYQIKKAFSDKLNEKHEKQKNYLSMVSSEITTNNKLLKAIDENFSDEQKKSILKYSLSTAIFLSVAAQLPHDNKFLQIQKYYTILIRLQKDNLLLTKDGFESLQKDIHSLIEIEKELK